MANVKRIRQNIFLIRWCAADKFSYEVARQLKHNGCDIRYWVRMRSGRDPDPAEFPETICQDTSDAIRARPAKGVDVSAFDPPGREVFEGLFECESTALAMMSRMDYSNTPFFKRKRLYKDLVKYWYGVLCNMRPDAVVFFATPHVVYDYVLYCVAKLLGIKTLIVYPTRLYGRTVIVFDIKRGPENLLADLSSFQTDVKIEDLSEDIREYYRLRSNPTDNFRYHPKIEEQMRFTERDERVKNFYVPPFSKVLRAVRQGNIFGKTIHYLYKISMKKSNILTLEEKDNRAGLTYEIALWRWRRAKAKQKKEYESLVSAVDWNKNFIFVGLPRQPERSTCPDGGVFDDQLLVIDILSHSIPRDWMIYVKEHPIQWAFQRPFSHLGRYQGYYKELASINNVALVHADITPDKFIEKCRAVATVTGTVAMEAVLRGKPALTFGFIPYKGCSGILEVSNVDSCRQAIAKIARGFAPDNQQILNYLGALDRTSVKWKNHSENKNAPLSADDCARAREVACFIAREIHQ